MLFSSDESDYGSKDTESGDVICEDEEVNSDNGSNDTESIEEKMVGNVQWEQCIDELRKGTMYK